MVNGKNRKKIIMPFIVKHNLPIMEKKTYVIKHNLPIILNRVAGASYFEGWVNSTN